MPFARKISASARLEAGCDEVGRGALAGPVVAAAVVLPTVLSFVADLQDSKTLSVAKREQMARCIQQDALGWGIGQAEVEEVERLNVLEASFLAMHRALKKLTVPFRHILVDGPYFRPYSHLPHTCIIGGDGRHPSIAAASIIAKVHRDHLMRTLAAAYPAYGWDRNKGYGTPQHLKALRTFSCSPHHRRTFRPCALQASIRLS